MNSHFIDRFSKKKCSNIKFHENPSSGSRVFPCGRTDRQKWLSFSQFCWGAWKSLLRAKHDSLGVKGIYCGEGKQKPAAPFCLTYATRLRITDSLSFSPVDPVNGPDYTGRRPVCFHSETDWTIRRTEPPTSGQPWVYSCNVAIKYR